MTRFSKQHGISLLELLLTLSLGVILVSAAMLMFFSSKQTYHANLERSSGHETARFASLLLSKEIHSAGYQGVCLGAPVNHLNPSMPASPMSIWYEKLFVQGFENTLPSFFSPTALTGDGENYTKNDSLFVQHAAYGHIYSGNTENTKDDPVLRLGDSGLNNFEVHSLIAADGVGCDIFQIAGEGNFDNRNTTVTQISKKGDTNWSHGYNEPFELLNVQRTLYYLNNNTLYKAKFSYDYHNPPKQIGQEEEILNNITRLKFRYGIKRKVEDAIEDYKSAKDITAEEWPWVAAIKVSISAQAASVGANDEQNTYDLDTIIFLRNWRGAQ